jgi:hypothetical protein
LITETFETVLISFMDPDRSEALRCFRYMLINWH